MIIFKDNVEALVNEFRLHIRVTLPEESRALADDMLAILTNVTRKHIPAGHRLVAGQRRLSTGRLWSGWGDRNQGVITNNPASNPGDNVAEIRRRRGRNLRFQVIVGTNVPYAEYVNDGRGPGERHAYGFVEKGKVESQQIILPMVDQRLQDALDPDQKRTTKRSFSATAQRRNILGQFAK